MFEEREQLAKDSYALDGLAYHADDSQAHTGNRDRRHAGIAVDQVPQPKHITRV